MAVPAEAVIWGYRLFLGREPDDAQAIEGPRNHFDSVNQLKEYFMGSAEFRNGNRAFDDLVIREAFRDVEVVARLDRYGVDGRIHVNLTDAIGRNVAIGTYEADEIAFMKRHLAEGDTLLDIGGNIGTFALVGSWCVGPTGRVITIEALSQNVASLRRSIAENGFARNVTVIQAIVAEREAAEAYIGYQTLEDGSGNSGGGSLVSADERLPRHLRRERIAQSTLDRLLGADQPVSFIKIDVEGAEILAFRGAADLLSRQSPIIMSEVHTDQLRKISGGDWREYFRLMKGYGYDAFMLEGCSLGRPAEHLEDGRIYNVVFRKN